MRRDYAKTAFSGAADAFLTGAKYILLIPATPILFFSFRSPASAHVRRYPGVARASAAVSAPSSRRRPSSHSAAFNSLARAAV